MKYGFVLPFGDARMAADLARAAERAGWDGVFVWEPVWGNDAWVSLTAAAMQTDHIRLGTMLSAVSRMRPWKLASEAASLDKLSNGRVILGVGLGAVDSGFEAFGEITERRTRAELVDEGLDIMTGLWRGLPFKYDGKHYKVDVNKKTFPMSAPPPPVQKPRIPIWVVAAWPRPRSMRRALRCDGLLPNIMGEDGRVRMGPPTPDEIRAIRSYVDSHRTETTPFDIVVEGRTPGDNLPQAQASIRPYADAGATWWLEAIWDAPHNSKGLEIIRARIEQHPPRID